MASKRRIKRRVCETKQKRSADDADAYIAYMAEKHPNVAQLYKYRCDTCGSWHVTRMFNSDKPKRREPTWP